MLLSVWLNVSEASVSDKVIVGAIANSSTPQGLVRPSNSALDIAIAGTGFIPLRSQNGSPVYTRNGKLGMDRDGDLQQVSSGLKVLVPDKKGNLTTVSLVKWATRPSANQKRDAKLTAMSFTEEGSLNGLYSDGEVATIASLKLAAFENQRYLKSINTKDPVFEATTESGEASYVTPREHPAGTIYGHHLELLPTGDEK